MWPEQEVDTAHRCSHANRDDADPHEKSGVHLDTIQEGSPRMNWFERHPVDIADCSSRWPPAWQCLSCPLRDGPLHQLTDQ
jgi:hypothetical protein